MDFVWDRDYHQYGNKPFDQAYNNYNAKIREIEKFQVDNADIAKSLKTLQEKTEALDDVENYDKKSTLNDTSVPDWLRAGYSLDQIRRIASSHSVPTYRDYKGSVGDFDE